MDDNLIFLKYVDTDVKSIKKAFLSAFIASLISLSIIISIITLVCIYKNELSSSFELILKTIKSSSLFIYLICFALYKKFYTNALYLYFDENKNIKIVLKQRNKTNEAVETISKDEIKDITYNLGVLYVNLNSGKSLMIQLDKINKNIYSKFITSLFYNYPDKIDEEVAKRISKPDICSQQVNFFKIIIIVIIFSLIILGIAVYTSYRMFD